MDFKHLEKVLVEYGERVKETYRGYLQSEGINASGSLSNTISVNVDGGENTYEVSLNLNEYWKWLEGGRAPTRNGGNGELRRNILEWIRVKPVLPKPFNGKLPTEAQLAYLISRKIHKFGYEGKGLLRKSQDDNEEFLLQVEYALLEDISEDIDKIMILFK